LLMSYYTLIMGQESTIKTNTQKPQSKIGVFL